MVEHRSRYNVCCIASLRVNGQIWSSRILDISRDNGHFTEMCTDLKVTSDGWARKWRSYGTSNKVMVVFPENSCIGFIFQYSDRKFQEPPRIWRSGNYSCFVWPCAKNNFYKQFLNTVFTRNNAARVCWASLVGEIMK